MISRLKQLVTRAQDKAAPSGSRVRLAAAALLVEAATMDGSVDAAEREAIRVALAGRFGLPAAEADLLLAEAEAAAHESAQLVGFTREIKDAFSYEERVEMIEMLWEVAYADGRLHDYEANLVRRVAGLLYVSDQDAGAARKRVLGRSG